MKNIYLIVGESGSGKTTIVNRLEELHGLTSIQSYTTRPKRTEDETGHTFVSDDEFDRLKDIVAFTSFCGFRYCATKEQIEDSDLYVIDTDGIKMLKEMYNGEKGIKVIYLSCPMQERMKRLEARDGFDKALERIKNDVIVFRGADKLADRVISTAYVDIDIIVGYVWEYIRECENG